ncbi:MAG: multidrug ABC transporter ATP-binding protein [Planctomycetaceae bacterium]|nr:multidrug ABC transporter ATP-binding protein [Planctomycetaceae bacterium]
METIAIRCRELVKTYAGRPPVEAVRGIDMAVAAGECFGVLGPNGAGKTTTIEILEGLLVATSGEVEILGMQWRQSPDAIREAIGISLQETRFSDKLSVLETLTLFRSFYRRGIAVADAVQRVGLEDKLHAWVKDLSGGQRQRLAVAAAIVGDPRLLFLDEPTTGLDPQSRRQLWEIIRQYGAQGRSVLLTTHYMEEAEQLCDRVAIIDQGEIIALGSPRELITRLGGEHVVEFTLAPQTAGADRTENAWAQFAHVTSSVYEDGCHRLTVTEPHLVIPQILGHLEQRGGQLASLTTRHARLEDVFVQLTGRHLEESPPNT